MGWRTEQAEELAELFGLTGADREDLLAEAGQAEEMYGDGFMYGDDDDWDVLSEW